MNKKFCAIAAACVLAALSFFSPIANAQPKESQPLIRVGYFAFSNFQDVDAKGNYSGYGYDYLQEIAKHTGWQYEYVFASWEDCQEKLAKGEIDLLGSAQYTPERATRFDYAKLDSGISYAVLSASSNNTDLAYEDFHAFDGMRVGLLKGNSRNFTLLDYCRENGFTVRPILFDNQRDLLSALHTGTVDAILTSNLRKEGNERIIARFAPSPFYFITTKGNQAVLKPLNAALTQIKLTNPHFDAELYSKHYSVEKTDVPVFTRAEREYLTKHPRLRVAYHAALSPISMVDAKSGRFGGIVEGVLRDITENTGLAFDFVPVPDIAAGAALLESGAVDIINLVPLTYRFSSQSGTLVSAPYLSAISVLVTDPRMERKGDEAIAMTEDYWLSVSGVRGDSRIKRFPTVEKSFEALLNGTVSGVYTNIYLADMLRTNATYSHLQLTAMPDLKYDLGMAVHRTGDPRLLSILNKAIQYISPQEQQDIVLKNTLVVHKLTIMDFLRQNPLSAIAVISVFLLIVIAFLSYLVFLRHRNNKNVYRLLYVDDLTGIWNFNYFMAELKKALTTEKKSCYAVVYMDIERFKDINETMGYAQGDFILKNIARILKENTHPDELFARVTNDNFIGLLRYEDEKSFVERLVLFHNKFNNIPKNERENHKLMLISGTYVIRDDDTDAATVVDGANDARKTLKGRHKSGYAFFNDQLRNALLEQREIEQVMETALEAGQFVPFYQPKVDLETSAIIGAEALVRWQHPERGLVPPFQFIPLFEKNGFIVEVDFFIFESVCRMIRRQLDAGRTPPPISSNFSRVHFTRPGFISRLKEISVRYQIPPQLLELEITENMVEENPGALLSILNELRLYGFHIAMDDFGSGYSSLNLLKTMPLDTLKLDKDFLQKGIVSEKERIIIAGFVEIAKKLDFSVVCEGVETQEQASFLRSIGCDYAQGYLYAKPMPLAAFESLVYEGGGTLA